MNKAKEKIIFKYIYKSSKEADIIEKEKPDFWVKEHDGEYFGVEVTEYYYSEADARVKNIPHYVTGILENGIYSHKKDKKELKVSDAKILKPDGATIPIRGILRENQSLEDYLKAINNIIQNKDKKILSYDKKLDYVNLIILDNERTLRFAEPDRFYELFYTSLIKQTILESKYREIYLITEFNGQGLLYFPLKQLLYVAIFYIFNGVLSKYYCSIGDIEDNEYVAWVDGYLKHLGFNEVTIIGKGNTFEIIYGNTGIVIPPGKGKLIIYDYMNCKIPAENQRIELSTGKYMTEEFKKRIEDYSKEVTFVGGPCFPVNDVS